MAAIQMIKKIVATLFLFLTLSVYAETTLHQFSNDENRDRFRQLTVELRCPKCQNQDLADSNAPIATDLRNQIIAMIEQGKSNQEIVDYMVSRYGDFVLYKPRFSGFNMFLWLTPLFLVGLGLFVVFVIVRANKKTQLDLPLEDEKKQRALRALLDGDDKP